VQLREILRVGEAHRRAVTLQKGRHSTQGIPESSLPPITDGTLALSVADERIEPLLPLDLAPSELIACRRARRVPNLRYGRTGIREPEIYERSLGPDLTVDENSSLAAPHGARLCTD
jgi:hypothetical protein